MLIFLAYIAGVLTIPIVLVILHCVKPLTAEDNALIDQEAEAIRRSRK